MCDGVVEDRNPKQMRQLSWRVSLRFCFYGHTLGAEVLHDGFQNAWLEPAGAGEGSKIRWALACRECLKRQQKDQGNFERVGIVHYDRSRCAWVDDQRIYLKLNSEQIRHKVQTVTNGRQSLNIVAHKEAIAIV